MVRLGRPENPTYYVWFPQKLTSCEGTESFTPGSTQPRTRKRPNDAQALLMLTYVVQNVGGGVRSPGQVKARTWRLQCPPSETTYARWDDIVIWHMIRCHNEAWDC